nr:unnamed protein product [Digitaria exilis]
MGWDQTYLVVERVLGLMSEDAEGKEAADSTDSWTYATERERGADALATAASSTGERREAALPTGARVRGDESYAARRRGAEREPYRDLAAARRAAARMIHQRRRSAALALDFFSSPLM